MKREELINRIKGRTYEPNDKLTLEIAYSDLWILIADELQTKEVTDEMIERFMKSVIALHPTFQMDDPKQEECYLAYHDLKAMRDNLIK